MNRFLLHLMVLVPMRLKALDERGGGNQSGENVVLLGGAILLAVTVVGAIAVYVGKKLGALP